MELFLELPIYLRILMAFGFGVIIGSFLNVYVYRFHTGKSLSGKSHCLSCGTPIKSYDLVPLLSYLSLRGRCRSCRSMIPVRYFLVELLTGVLFVGASFMVTNLALLLVVWFLLAVLVVIAVYDLYHLIIPDELVVTLTGIALLLQGYSLYLYRDPAAFALDFLAAALGVIFFFGLWHYSGGRWVGFGDVKLAMPLGLMVSAGGVFSMIVLAFWVGAIIGLVLMAWQKGRQYYAPHTRLLGKTLHLKSAIPFAPFLIVGFLLVFFYQINVISLVSYAY